MLALLLSACRRPEAPPPPPPPPPPTIAERFGDWPFLTPIDAPPTVALVAGGEVPARADVCGGCHPDHLAEWRGSTHAAALADLQYLGELAKPGQPRWLCLNCHLPTRPQRQDAIRPETRLATASDVTALARAPEPAYDPTRVPEALSCPTCHVRRDDDGAGVVVGPRGSGRAPHRVRVDPAGLGAICERCHSPGPATLTPTFTCWFESREELERGPSAGATCPSCHMPEATRPAAVGAPEVRLRRHLWLGGGVPKAAAGYGRLAASGFETGFDVSVAADPLTVTLTNTRAGHLVPTADPERHLRVEARAEDAAGNVLGRALLRIGQTWDWGDAATGRPARRLTDDRLAPGVPRVWTPTLPPGADRVVVEVAHVRMAPATARWLAGVALDGELAGYAPEAPARLAEVDLHYPLGTVVHRTVLPAGGPPVTTPLAALLAESEALVAAPFAEKEARYAIPEP